MINEFNDNIQKIYVNSAWLVLYLRQEDQAANLVQFLLTVMTIQQSPMEVPPDYIRKAAIFCADPWLIRGLSRHFFFRGRPVAARREKGGNRKKKLRGDRSFFKKEGYMINEFNDTI